MCAEKNALRAYTVLVFVLAALYLWASVAFADAEALSQAEFELAQGNYDNVFAICDGLLTADWTDADAHVMMGKSYLVVGDSEAAMASFRQAAKILAARVANSQNDEAAQANRASLAWVSAAIAIGGRESGDRGSVLEFGQQAYYLGSTDRDALLALANAYVDAERYSLAVPVLTKAIAEYRANEGDDDYAFEMHNLKGICLYYADDFAGSCAEYALAETYGAGDLKFYGNWAFSLEGAGEWQNALDMWIKVSGMDCPDTHMKLVKEHIESCRKMVKGG